MLWLHEVCGGRAGPTGAAPSPDRAIPRSFRVWPLGAVRVALFDEAGETALRDSVAGFPPPLSYRVIVKEAKCKQDRRIRPEAGCGTLCCSHRLGLEGARN